jgi:hypothetical protein
MLDVDTFLTALYVIVDDLCQSQASEQRRPGPPASLCQSEVVTLSIFARWSRFASESDFYRYAEAHLRGAFPNLPDRSQFNRLVRFYADALEEIAVKLGETLKGEPHPYQALDSSWSRSAVRVRSSALLMPIDKQHTLHKKVSDARVGLATVAATSGGI